jgi:predicted N-acetyltransferase YhbS
MKYKILCEADIEKVIPLYLEYYNNHEGTKWTKEKVFRRIHQVWSCEGSYCLILENGEKVLGFAMGYLEQYDDCKAYNLAEIVIASEYQKKGIGTALMMELEHRVKGMGAALIQLQAVNDAAHSRFYGRLGYQNANNLILKTKWL